ncbi:MAG: methyltransferase domain-containing protein [Patescibacteria group bacterium]
MFIAILKQLAKKKSLLRSLMNIEASNYSISGDVLDLGGGVSPTYFNFLKKEIGTKILNLDLKNEGREKIDFEKDLLPVTTESVQGVLAFNLLEHIYNYRHLTREAARVLKQRGQMIGFVPFLINYHPDPNDYFRYTRESLQKIFTEAGFKEVQIKAIGVGPLAVNFNILAPFLPTILRCLLFPFYYCLDKIILRLRPKMTERYPLGYFFSLTK